MKTKYLAAVAVVGLMLATGISGCIGGGPSAPTGQEKGNGWIYGKVTNETGTALQGVEVAVGNETIVMNTTKSAVDGTYTIPNLLPGIYVLGAKLEGYGAFIKDNVSVEADKGTKVDIALSKSIAGELKVEKVEEEGSIPAPSAGAAREEGMTHVNFTFQVKEGAALVIVCLNCTNKELQARPDFDLYIYAPNGKQVAASATEGADEKAVMKEQIIKKGGYGEWIAMIDNFSGVNAGYKITVEVYYPAE